ncbi:MAG: lysophospholipid acyltransferase family protein [bacterium]
MKLILQKIHFFWYMFMVALTFYIMYPLFYYNTRKASRYHRVAKLRKIWCDWGFILGFYSYKVEYEADVDYNKPMIIVANHTSYLDTPLICTVIAGNYHFMGKVELLKNPVLRLFFQTIDVPVDRSNRIASYRALKRVEENIKSGLSLILYPEGTMSKNPPVMGDFKAGAFKLAVDTKVPILPISFLNNYKLMKGSGLKFGSKPGIMRVFVHKPIETKDLSTAEDLENLSKKIFETLNSKL